MALSLIRRFSTLVLLLAAGLAHAQGPDEEAYSADPPDRAARLSLIRGDVSLQPAGEEEWAPALLNRPLTTGDKLWTDRGARAEVQVGQAAVRLNSDTGFSFLDLSDDTVQMRLTAGTLIVDVRELSGREHLEIDTPNVALSILRPGTYRVEVSDDGDLTRVKVSEGEVEASGPGQNVIVHARQVVTFRGVDQLVADWGSLGPRDEFDEWSLERDRRADRLASSQSSRYVSPEVTGYDDLDEYGSWSSEPDYGYVWTPSRVVVGWSPYRFGRWVWVSPWGWTWIDDSPWGYAPFHYGRWVHVRHRWCWVPGPRHIRPVFAPALVGWVGVRGGHVSWVPLGPRDVYVPWRPFSRHYIERVNFANSRAVVREHVRDAIERRVTEGRSHNRAAPDAITSVTRSAFTSGQRVGDRRVRFDERQMGGLPENGRPQITPVRESRLGGVVRASPRIPQGVAARQVIVRRDPPPSSARFARRLQPDAGQLEAPSPRIERPRERGRDAGVPPGAGVDRGAVLRERVDRPDRPDRPPRADSSVPQAEPRLPERVREAREAQTREDYLRERIEQRERVEQRERGPRGNDESRWRREETDRPPPDAPHQQPQSGEQYPQYSQRPVRTEDQVREAMSRRLQQPPPEYRERENQRPREQPRMEQPRVEQPRVERPREERRIDLPRMERPREERQSAPERSQPRSEPKGRQDDDRHDRHPRR